MTLHPPRKEPWTAPVLRESRPRQRSAAPPAPLTLGQVLGDAVRATLHARERRAELDAMGFRPLGSDATRY